MITISKFQNLFAISKMDLNELDKSTRLVQCLTGKSEYAIDKMSLKKYNRLCVRLGKVFELQTSSIMNGKPSEIIRVNGHTYKVMLSVTDKEFNAGKYVEVSTFANDVINNLHKIMASICVPVKWSWLKFKYIATERSHEGIANDMLDADFSKCYHAAVFFYAVYKKTMSNLQPYLIKEMKTKGATETEAMEALMLSQNILGGFTMPKWLQTSRI